MNPSSWVAASAAVLLTACSTMNNDNMGAAVGATGSAADARGNAQTGPAVSTRNVMAVQPSGPRPAWAPTIDPQMQAVIEQFEASELPAPPTKMSAFQFRNVPLPAHAALEVMKKAGIPPQQTKVDVAHRILPVGAPEGILVRTYTPISGSKPLPVIVYFHGGGWVIADLDTYEPSAKALAEKSGAIVVSVAYRQAPEHRFPTAHQDAFAAYRWVTENAGQLGGDPKLIAVAGESAGGNLAVAVSLMAKRERVALPVHIVSVYPIADGDTQSPSYKQYAKAKPLNKGLMDWFFGHYTPNAGDRSNELISLVRADLRGLPPTTVINAEIDPLKHEGGVLAERMRRAGVDVVHEVYGGVTHEFFGMADILGQAKAAQDLAAKRLRTAFAQAGG